MKRSLLFQALFGQTKTPDIVPEDAKVIIPGQPELTITREPMPLAYRDLNEHDVFEIGGCLFIRMSDHAVCFKTSRSSMVGLGKWKPNDLTHVRLVTDLYAKVEGGMLTRGKFGDA
jgi:hypothetical protein